MRSLARIIAVAATTAGAVLACGSQDNEPEPAVVTDHDPTVGQNDAAPMVVPAGDAATDSSVPPPTYDPVLLIHGIKGSAEDFATMKQALITAGWPQDRVLARTFPDPAWGCSVDNAALIATWVDEALKQTGSDRVDIVAHSMGTLSSRYFMTHLGGAGKVRTYLTIGGMHHGLTGPCFSPLDVCVWKELCTSGPFIADLNASGPSTLGPTKWVSIFSTDDGTVPASSSHVDGAENIQFTGLTHMGLLSDAKVETEVERVLRYSL